MKLTKRLYTKVMASLMDYCFRPIMIVHGGAGPVPPERKVLRLEGCKKAAMEGYKVLTELGNVADAVEAAIRVMEDDKSFNAGKGSSLTIGGVTELDASIMVGENLNAGVVSCITNVKNPISVARKLMDKTKHTTLSGEAANEFAKKEGIQTFPQDGLQTLAAKKALEHFKKFKMKFQKDSSMESDSVGAVALDGRARLAAGTSTGGITGKMDGRVSDVGVMGCATYADDNFGAFAVSGFGEHIILFNLAHRLVKEMEFGKKGHDSAKFCLKVMDLTYGSRCGIIGLSKFGEIVIDSNTDMPWAYQRENILSFGTDNIEVSHEILR